MNKSDKEKVIENHIIGESFKEDGADIEKINDRISELESIKNGKFTNIE